MSDATQKVGMLFAESGEYEDYRARPLEVYESVDAGNAEADRRNALVATAREKMKDVEELERSDEDGSWELAEKRRKRITNKLRRETTDPGIESHDIYDLTYIVTEARLVR